MSASEDDEIHEISEEKDGERDEDLLTFRLVTGGLKRHSVWRYFDLLSNEKKKNRGVNAF